MRTKKRRLLAPLWIALALLATACAGSAPPQVETVRETVVVEQRETVVVEQEVQVVVTATPEAAVVPDVPQVFTIGFGRDTGPLDPRSYSFQSFIGLSLVYEPLVVYNADGSISPGLAESWDISDDGLTWTFHLRPGVTFHDGAPFDSAAAKWNLEQWVGTERHSWLPTANIIESIDTPDDLTVVLNLSEYNYTIFYDLSLVRPVRFMSPNGVDADGNFLQAIGTGPWMLADYTPDQRSSFVPFADYWGEKPTLSEVVFEVIPDPQTRIAALLSGEVNLIGGENIGGISLESIPVLERNPEVELVTGEGSTGYLIMANYNRPPFDDARVRQAINYAIDRQAISDQIFQGLAAPAQGMFPENVPYVTYPHPELYAYNPEAATALLAEAGWTPGDDGILQKDGQPFTVDLVVDATGFPQVRSVAEVVQAELMTIGINLELRLTEFGGWSDALTTGDYDLATNITYGAPYDPHSVLTALFRTGFTGTEGTVFTDPTLDAMVDEVLTIIDEDERQAKYNEIWAFMDENAAAIPIVYSLRVYALNSEVQGFHLAGTEYDLDLSGVTIGAN